MQTIHLFLLHLPADLEWNLTEVNAFFDEIGQIFSLESVDFRTYIWAAQNLMLTREGTVNAAKRGPIALIFLPENINLGQRGFLGNAIIKLLIAHGCEQYGLIFIHLRPNDFQDKMK